MNVTINTIPTPVKISATLNEIEISERKTKFYESQKASIEVTGFRKGNVPQNIAEDKIGVERFYKPMIDQIYVEIAKNHNVVSSRDFKFYGDLKAKVPFTIEFTAELKPTVDLVNLEQLETELDVTFVSDEDLKKRIDAELKQNEKIEDSAKEVLEDFDVANIDFEGRLENETTPFKGGTAKGYQIAVNELVNGRKNFIDNFEDQIIGMKLGEKKEIKVKFPDDYGNKELSGKYAIFTVVLNSIKTKFKPVFDESFAKLKGYDSVEKYTDFLKKELLDNKEKEDLNNFKKKLISEVIEKSKFSAIPEDMIRRENEKEWGTYLKRMGKTEEQLVKENKSIKEMFFDNMMQRSVEVIKITLVIEKIAEVHNIVVSDEDVVKYSLKIPGLTKETIQNQQDLMKIAARNEKAIEFLCNVIAKVKE